MMICTGGTFNNYKGYEGVYEYSEEDNAYCGKIINTDDIILFEGLNLSELYQSFKEAVDDYIEILKKFE